MINNLRNNPKDDSIPTAKDMIATLKMKHLWIVMLFIMFTGTFYGIYDGQMFPDFYTKLFDNEKQDKLCMVISTLCKCSAKQL